MRDEVFAKHIGQNISRARLAANLSQDALAYMAGIRRTEVGNIESGRRIPRADTLLKLAQCMEADYDEIFAGLTWRPPHPQIGRMEVAPG